MGSVGYRNQLLFPKVLRGGHPLPQSTVEAQQKGNVFLFAVWLGQEEIQLRNVVSFS
jgi:hypothetical protein